MQPDVTRLNELSGTLSAARSHYSIRLELDTLRTFYENALAHEIRAAGLAGLQQSSVKM